MVFDTITITIIIINIVKPNTFRIDLFFLVQHIAIDGTRTHTMLHNVRSNMNNM